MLQRCDHCGIELECSAQDPMTAVLHIASCGESSTAQTVQIRPIRVDAKGPPRRTIEEINRLCPVCRQDIVGLPQIDLVDHFNSCWAHIMETTARGIHSATDTLQPPPTPSLSSITPVSTMQAIPPEMSCVICARDLSACSAIDALYHRAICFSRQPDKGCPICKSPLSTSTELFSGSLLHLQKCQQGTQDTFSFIENDDFEALYGSLCGRSEVTSRFFTRIEGDWRKSREAYKQKIQRKREHIDLVYELEESTLRNCVSVDGEEVEGWRTAGNAGKASRNVFPVVKEDFDAFIVFEAES